MKRRQGSLTVGSLVGKTPPRSGALVPEQSAVAWKPLPLAAGAISGGARASVGAAAPRPACCGRGCPGCPYMGPGA